MTIELSAGTAAGLKIIAALEEKEVGAIAEEVLTKFIESYVDITRATKKAAGTSEPAEVEEFRLQPETVAESAPAEAELPAKKFSHLQRLTQDTLVPVDGLKMVRLRRQRGLRQKQLAVLSGVNNNTISNWETGSTLNGGIKKIAKIAEALKVQVEELIRVP